MNDYSGYSINSLCLSNDRVSHPGFSHFKKLSNRKEVEKVSVSYLQMKAGQTGQSNSGLTLLALGSALSLPFHFYYSADCHSL
jgi:hypothetical protein